MKNRKKYNVLIRERNIAEHITEHNVFVQARTMAKHFLMSTEAAWQNIWGMLKDMVEHLGHKKRHGRTFGTEKRHGRTFGT